MASPTPVTRPVRPAVNIPTRNASPDGTPSTKSTSPSPSRTAVDSPLSQLGNRRSSIGGDAKAGPRGGRLPANAFHQGGVKIDSPAHFEQMREARQLHRLEQQASARNDGLLKLDADHPFRRQHEANLQAAQNKLAQFHIDKMNERLAGGRPDSGRVHERTRDQFAGLARRFFGKLFS
jgi:hypothetical protein